MATPVTRQAPALRPALPLNRQRSGESGEAGESGPGGVSSTWRPVSQQGLLAALATISSTRVP